MRQSQFIDNNYTKSASSSFEVVFMAPRNLYCNTYALPMGLNLIPTAREFAENKRLPTQSACSIPNPTSINAVWIRNRP